MLKDDYKKDLIIGTIAIIVFTILSIQTSGYIYIYDNFDGSFGTGAWNVSGNGSGNVQLHKSNIQSYSNPISTFFQNLPVATGGYANYRLNKSFPTASGSDHLIITAWIYLNSSSSNFPWIFLSNGIDTPYGDGGYFAYNGGNAYYRNSAGSQAFSACSITSFTNTFVNYTIDLTLGSASSTADFYINGTKCLNAVNYYKTTAINFVMFSDGSSSDGFNGYIDNFCVYNTSCTITPPVVDLSGPKITFKEQTPTPIIFGSVFGQVVNITYNITDETDVNNNTVYLFSGINLTGDQLINEYVNGTPLTGYEQFRPSKNLTSNYSFNIYDNDVFYALYNLNESLMEITTKKFYDCGGSTCLYYGEFYNFTNKNPYNILEVDIINNNSNPRPLEIGICNERVLSPSTSLNCTPIYSGVNIPINHTHNNGKSNHSTVSFTFDSTNGKINGVWINSTIYPYVLFDNLPTKQYVLGYVPIESRKNANSILNSLGTGFNDLNGTWDMHIHQNATIFQYYVCANDTLGNSNCSESKRVSISQSANLAPDSPIFINPNISEVITNPLNNLTYLSWYYGLSPSGNALSYCKIDLLNSDYNYISTVNTTVNYPLSSIYWKNSNNYTSVSYNLTCCDVIGLCSNSISRNMTYKFIDSAPIIPPSNNTGITVIINNNFNTSAIDNLANQTKYNVDMYINIGLLVIAVIVFIFGVFSTQKWLISVTGILFFISSLFFGNYARSINDNLLYISLFFVFMLIGIITLFLGMYWQFSINKQRNDFLAPVRQRYKHRRY